MIFILEERSENVRKMIDARFREKLLSIQLVLQAILQFRADLSNFHTGAYHEFAAKKFVRAILVRQLADNAAILAILIPAEASVGNGFRADVLKRAENGVLFRDIKRLPQNLDCNEPFIWAKYLRRPIGCRDWF